MVHILLFWLLLFFIVGLLWVRFPIRRDRLLTNHTLLTLLGVLIVLIVGTAAVTVAVDFPITYSEGGMIFENDTNSKWWNTYYLFIDAGNQHAYATNQESRIVVGIIGFFSLVLLNGFLISALMTTFDSHKERLATGVIRYKKYALNNHIVIIGGNDMVPQIIEHYKNYNHRGKPKLDRIVLILTNRNVEEFRRELFASLGFDSWRVIIYYGDRTSIDDIDSLNIPKAAEVFVLGEESTNDDAESYHDTLNMSCVRHINKILTTAKRNSPLVCHVMFEYQTTFAALQIANIDKAKVKFRPFNFYETWGQKCFAGEYNPEAENQPYYIPLDGKGIGKDDDAFVNLVIVGMSRMGVALGHTAAHMAHYPNFITKGVRTRITFIDTNADTERDFLKGRYHELFKLARYRTIDTTQPNFNPQSDVAWENNYYTSHLGTDFIDVEWEFVNGGIETEGVRGYLRKIANTPNVRLTVAICLPESNKAVATAIYLPDTIYCQAQQVLVYQRKNNILVDDINIGNARYHNKLRAFGMVSKCYDFEQIDELNSLGAAVGEAYNEYNRKLKEKHRITQEVNVPSTGKTPLAKLWSNYYNILSLRAKLRSFGVGYLQAREGFREEHLELLGQVEHNRWLMEQLLLGFRPASSQEQKEMVDLLGDFQKFEALKDKYKKEFIHLDICSNKVLSVIDPESVGRDTALLKSLPEKLHDYIAEKKQKTQ